MIADDNRRGRNDVNTQIEWITRDLSELLDQSNPQGVEPTLTETPYDCDATLDELDEQQSNSKYRYPARQRPKRL